MDRNLPHRRPFPEAAISAPIAREDEGLREGHMGAMRVFVVLCWAVFALRQIFMKPVRVLVSKD